MSHELGPRLGCPCPVEFADQTDFSEPLVRVNQDLALRAYPQWSEARAWDEAADYYRAAFG
jgi:hypothetical protein